MLRHRYPIWPLIHLISIGLWIALFILLVCMLMGLLCRRRMRMFHSHGRYRCHGQGQGHCGCYGRGQGHCGGQSHDHGCGGSHGYCSCGPTPPPSHLDALEILRQRYARGEIDDATMYATFNMGIGFCVVVAESQQQAALDALRAAGEDALRIGTVTGRPGRTVTIPSAGLTGKGDSFEPVR